MLKYDVPLVDKSGVFDPNWYAFFDDATSAKKVVTLDYGSTVSTDVSRSNIFNIVATTSASFVVDAPTGSVNGRVISYTIKNSAGSALGTVTFNSVFKMSTFSLPANGFNRTWQFHFDGTNWIMRYQTAADVPN